MSLSCIFLLKLHAGELCRIPNNERAPLPVAVALTKAHMYGSPPAPEHVKRIEEHEAQKKVLDPETRIEQTPLVVPPPPSQPEGADSESVQPSREDEHGNCVLGHVEAMDNRGGQVREHTTDEATDKKPVYYREWFNGQTDTECKFSIDDDEADINRMWELWEEYFGRQGIRPNTKYPFELCIPANKSRLFFGAQGSAIKQIMALCLTPIRICTRYDSEWLYVGLWFRKMARSPRMPLLQMYSILHHWSITLDQGLFFDVKLGQEIEQRARVLAGQVGDSMWRQRSSTTVRESTIVGDEDECADREME